MSDDTYRDKELYVFNYLTDFIVGWAKSGAVIQIQDMHLTGDLEQWLHLCAFELDLGFKAMFCRAGLGGLRVTGRGPGRGLVDLQSRDEGLLHPASTTCGRKRGLLTGP